MPRSLVLGNGRLLATFDASLQLRDLYYPYVGMEDHTTFGNAHRLGFWSEGRGFSWVTDPGWSAAPAYRTDTLTSQSTLEHAGLDLQVRVEDSVHPVHDVLVRRFFIRSKTPGDRIVKLFAHHDFHIYGDKQKDTAFYEPHTNTVIHYRQTRYFLVGGDCSRPAACRTPARGAQIGSVLHSMNKLGRSGLTSFAVGKSNYQGLEGTWRDAEDGQLSENTVVQGSVDSCVSVEALVNNNEETEVAIWLCLGQSLQDVVNVHQQVMDDTPERLQRNSSNYWKSWVNKANRDFGSLPEQHVDLFKRSLLTLRTHADDHGGIVAAADSDIMAFNRDTYTYVWPRDGALVSLALDRAGYGEVTRRFFDFCARAQMPDGYLLHKFNPDGSLGSTWHPWYRDGETQLPIQEDETALPIVALWNHFQQTQDFEFLQGMYERFVKKAAAFLCAFREEETGLPMLSYDPWEEHKGVFSYTVATVIAGLHAAAQIAQILGHTHHSHDYQEAADAMRQALLFHLYDEETGCFLKKIKRKGGTTTERDHTVDASIAMVWRLGVLPTDDPRVVSTMQHLEKHLTVRTSVGGLARYTNDYYHTVVPPTADIPGNPWIITTLWLTQWKIARAQTPAELAAARAGLDWALAAAGPAGLLPEQLHPVTGMPLSVSPLAWSHAAYVDTVLDYIERERQINGQAA